MASEIIAYVAVSLDGFIAGDGGSVDFLEQFGTDEYGFHEFFDSIDAVIMGSATYEQILGFGWPYGDTSGLVLTSRDLDVPADTDIRFSSHPTGIAIREYAADFERRVWVVGGGVVITEGLLEAAIDTLEMYVMPVALGSGTPLFASAYSGPLELVESRTFSNNVAKLVYATR